MNICPSEKCTGCAACVSVCSANCIKMVGDQWGELHPSIDDDRCISCGQCLKVCPHNDAPVFRYPVKCYAAWLEDIAKRLVCASGGIGTVIAEYFIKEEGGVVFGTAYDKDLNPRTVAVDNIEGVAALKGSKYVQGYVDSSIYKKVKSYCESGRRVAYIGLPCQISGLLNYLGKDYANLLTVDLICHGVCPASYLQEEVKHLKARHGIKTVADIRFRGNDTNDFRLTLWDENRNRVYNGSWWTHNRYFLGFIMGITLRENCFRCSYARPERVSDITLGDFIGLGKNGRTFSYSPQNVSCVMINTCKGAHFYDAVVRATPMLKCEEREYSERLEYRPSLLTPFPRHKYNNKFRRLVPNYGYLCAIQKTLRWFVFRSRVIGLASATFRLINKPLRLIKEKIW